VLEQGLSIVIPVYGSEKTIAPLCEQISVVFSEKMPSVAYEIVLVNDSSPDGVALVIESMKNRLHQVRCITLLRNFGQHNALLAGIRAASYDRIITMDDDGQHPAAAIPQLVESLTDNLDLVYAVPLDEKRGVFRGFASASVKLFLTKALGVGGAVNISSFRIFRTILRTAFEKYNSPVVFIDALLSWGTKRIGAIRIEHQKRIAGKSGYTLKKLIGHTLNMVTSFSVLPLRIATIIGLITILLGLAIFVFCLVRFFIVGREMPGFMLLVSAIILFSGVQLLLLGVLGEYVSRMHMSLMNRPAYAIRNG
jgi:undecaprenyl-phosphate 4-deoxy-4-formamido-L-arabinose transferase